MAQNNTIINEAFMDNKIKIDFNFIKYLNIETAKLVLYTYK
jgi:hypothetical protein